MGGPHSTKQLNNKMANKNKYQVRYLGKYPQLLRPVVSDHFHSENRFGATIDSSCKILFKAQSQTKRKIQ